MSEILPFVVAGIAAGAIYGLVATGLVLTYRTSGIFNFAQGAIAAAAAYVFYWLNTIDKMSWVPAAIISIILFGPLAGLGMERIARRLSRQQTAMKIVGTIGIILIVEGLSTVKFGPSQITVSQFLPKGAETFRIGGVNITYAELVIFIVAVIGVALLYWLLRATRLGVGMRAVVDDPELVSLHGKSPIRIRCYAWIIGSTFAAVSGILLAPLVGLQAIILTYLVVQAFGAAAIGMFRNIPLTFFGGLVLGIAASVSTKYVVNLSWLQGLPESLPFIVLLVVMLVTPRRKLAPQSTELQRAPLPWQAPPAGRLLLGVVVLALLVTVPLYAGNQMTFFIVGLSQAILILSLGLLVRTAGMVSLCQAAFAAIGAVAFAQFSANFHMPWLLAFFLGSLVVVPVAALLALPAIRLSGVFLALATFGFGIMVEQMFYPMNFMFTVVGGGRPMSRPSFAGSDTEYYYVVLVFVVFFAVVMYLIHRSRLGRMLGGMSESPLSVRIMGLNTNVTRIMVFCIAGFMAGSAGILYGGAIHVAADTDPYYASFYSLVILAILVISPGREPWYAVFAVVAAIIPGYLTSANTQSWLNVLFGFSAIVVAMNGGPQTLPQNIRAAIERMFGALSSRLHMEREQPIPSPRLATAAVVARDAGVRDRVTGLQVDQLSVHFGGLRALEKVTVDAPLGRITGLIGPNGAGKTTLFNACSGIVRPSEGSVALHGEDVTGMGQAARGERGLGRTFQVMQLCDSLSVLENVSLGCETGQAGARPWTQIVATPGQRRAARAAVADALDLCGIGALAKRQAGDLPTGQRRLVELARCLAGKFDVLLLDEPSSGLDPTETQQFATTLRDVVQERGSGVLLVEHDMSLVMTICSYVYVLDFGTLLFEGVPDEVRRSEVVQHAYLGEATPQEPAASGAL